MDHEQKQKQLKSIIKKLHNGVSVDNLKKEFAKIVKETSPEEIADMENTLIQEGFPPEEIQRLCDVHVRVFERSLKKVKKSGKIPGHPVYTFVQENKECKRILKRLRKRVRKLRKGVPKKEVIDAFKNEFERLGEIEKHFQRKENQLFPMLEAKKFTGPTQVMWGKHDEIRNMIREISLDFDQRRWSELSQKVKSLSTAIKKLIFLEEKILYPTSQRKLNTKEWAKIKMGGPEIGYAWVTPSNLWDARLARSVQTMQPEENKEHEMPEKNSGKIILSQGRLSEDQIDFMLKNLPIDITFVDENNKVCYYSDTRDRIFPRSPAVIGREVQHCHPPKSVHIVNDIIQNFREKKKEVAEFWIQLQGKFIHIRYFPLYDAQGEYRGVIEVSQEVSEIQKLEGERRLLDW